MRGELETKETRLVAAPVIQAQSKKNLSLDNGRGKVITISGEEQRFRN